MKRNDPLADQVLFENEDYIIINKPPFVSTLQDRHEPANVLDLVREWESDAQVGHRLDKDTSGCLAIARHPEAYRHLSMQFEHRTVEKVYHAVCDGLHRFDQVVVQAPIEKLNDGTVKLSREGKNAETSFSTLQVFKQHTLVECRPVTGRMHQIRIHLSYLGAPITGDDLYDGKPFYLSSVKRGFNLKKTDEEQPLMKRMALHAHTIRFAGLKGEKIDISAPYPKDFAALLRQLGQNLR
ncbi:MAG: RluA family pseudouridine synthase [Cyclobacteriaceae bacterium]